jgi:predicted phosphodiesterase
MRLAVLVLGGLCLGSAAHAARIDLGPYVQDVRPDGGIVVWETDAPVGAEVIVDTPAGPRRFVSPPATHHELRISGLPAGRHPYRVVPTDGESATGELTTAVTGSQFTFLVYGDNRDGDAHHQRVVERMAQEHSDLAINTGDLTSDGDVERLWRRFFAIEAPLLASVPLYPALGNHEVKHDPAAHHYHRFFALPGPPSVADHERYYAFRYGNAEFIALDSNQSHHHEQARWLQQTLSAAAIDPSIRHLFVYFHHPPFSNGPECGSAVEQGAWVPLFERYQVRAVFAGHEHAYQHMERGGVRYFVTGGGGAPLYGQSQHCPRYDRAALRVYRPEHHYLRVRVAADQVVLDAIAADGSLMETVRLHEPAPPDPAPPPPIPYVAEVQASDPPTTAAALPATMLPDRPPPHSRGVRALPIVVFAALGVLILILGLGHRRS